MFSEPIMYDRLEQSHEFFKQTLLTVLVDKFLNYITDLLTLIYIVRPEIMKSKEQERLDFILGYTSMQELIAAIAEKKINDLAYKSFKDVSDFLADKGFKLFNNADDSHYASKIVEMRNIIVHNRSRIGKISIRRFPELSGKEGEVVDMEKFNPNNVLEFFEKHVSDIDNRAAEHFKIGFTHVNEETHKVYLDFMGRKGFDLSRFTKR